MKKMFVEKAPEVMMDLMEQYGLANFQAAGMVGNIGRECGGFMILHELGQPAGRGGYGWCQWTGPRRVDFFQWCEQNQLPWESYGGNIGFLKHELSGAYHSTVVHVKQSKTVHEAATAFERYYERAGVVAMEDRWHWADRAMAAYKAKYEGANK